MFPLFSESHFDSLTLRLLDQSISRISNYGVSIRAVPGSKHSCVSP